MRHLLILLPLLLAACRSSPEAPTGTYAARVGERELSEVEVAQALDGLPLGLDSTTARQQIVEQWVTNELLAQEARRQGLLSDADVQRQLADNERAVLAAALVERFFATNPAEPTDDELQAFFTANREQLALREPYVRVRHLRTGSPVRAASAAESLRRIAGSPLADSLWAIALREYAAEPEGPRALAATLVPESRLAGVSAPLAERVRALRPGEVSEPYESGGEWHVVQVVERVPAGTVPQLAWIRDDLREQQAIEVRKQMLARQVQQLRSQAEARGVLDLR